jgi:hypothetical protein
MASRKIHAVSNDFGETTLQMARPITPVWYRINTCRLTPRLSWGKHPGNDWQTGSQEQMPGKQAEIIGGVSCPKTCQIIFAEIIGPLLAKRCRVLSWHGSHWRGAGG